VFAPFAPNTGWRCTEQPISLYLTAKDRQKAVQALLKGIDPQDDAELLAWLRTWSPRRLRVYRLTTKFWHGTGRASPNGNAEGLFVADAGLMSPFHNRGFLQGRSAIAPKAGYTVNEVVA
jgi:hypothetical protein